MFSTRLQRRPPFAQSTLEIARALQDYGTAGNRWFKVNLHVHSRGLDARALVEKARECQLDLIAVTEHQTFDGYEAIAEAATTPGRPLTVLPGIEITAHEGAHLLAIFPQSFSRNRQAGFLGWLEISGAGDTRIASKRTVLDIFRKVEDDEGGVIVVPHPFADNIGLLAPARKLSTKVEWINSGHVRLVQLSDKVRDKVSFVECDQRGNWFNRYVLTSASPEQIAESTYCLAPFNRSDAKTIDEIDDGCSWFRMQQPTVEGLKQVACEPRTRIALAAPPPSTTDCVLALRVQGGYCDGQVFRFNEALNCIVGQNYAGKSAVLDFMRFALGHDAQIDDALRQPLLRRLYGILGVDGQVELHVRKGSQLYVVKRTFDVDISGQGSTLRIEQVHDAPKPYRLEDGKLVPDQDFEFPIEVYEQGRIYRLRDDVSRQLEMLDEFAGVGEFKRERAEIVRRLDESAEKLAPWYEEREGLKSALTKLPELKTELEEKQKHLPGVEGQKWGAAIQVAKEIEDIVEELETSSSGIPDDDAELRERETQLECLFGQTAPDIDINNVAEAKLLTDWRDAVEQALTAIKEARAEILQAMGDLTKRSNELEVKWKKARDAHERAVTTKLAEAGFESPKELINRVNSLRTQVHGLEKVKRPRLSELNALIEMEELRRDGWLDDLDELEAKLTWHRQHKAQELTQALGGQIQITVAEAADRDGYRNLLDELCSQVSRQGHQIKKREGQLGQIVSDVLPRRLAQALQRKGVVEQDDGTEVTLEKLCDITENTQNVLCTIADSIKLLNRLQTLAVPDVPQIRIRRHGENTYADLRTGLSPGEQSAAILTLALQTRTMPLILDQPEDELGYSYVVHFIVPKMLAAKFSRQLIVVTHNANVPVLGDADYVLKMENRPREAGRDCVVAACGCFESRAVVDALLELEGGPQAFRFRQHRYSLPCSARET